MLSSPYNGFRRVVHRGFSLADRAFNAVFRPEFNPIYRSGTIAVVLMSLVTVTGLVLIFFYRLGDPWESVRGIQEQAWFGRWLRSIHRFASDATVAAVVLHVFRMFAQGKSWGPRAFSWITGVLLLFFLFLSAWTGFVMVWDTQAQVVAETGARIVDSLGILADPLVGSFNGVADTPPASFFFLNLFLHVVVPLGMIFGIWVHTSRMARATWFPRKNFLWGMVAVFVALGVALPAPLGPKADLLSLPVDVPLDRYFHFWIPFASLSPSATFWWWFGFFLLLSAIPWALRPRSESSEVKPAFNDPKICQGCTQCVKDCPYEAIQMVPRLAGPPVSETVAQVIPNLCVSCGLCSASCGPMTMGPPDRKGTHQYQAAKTLVASRGAGQALDLLPERPRLRLARHRVLSSCASSARSRSRISAARSNSSFSAATCISFRSRSISFAVRSGDHRS
ncbi:MAG: cytochrome b N-terminal domain-containing protein [Bdellovibrionales bacterium]|nr:cytochrome b N-terminal domain-containing protein [Bdellovibrionales bacterium]